MSINFHFLNVGDGDCTIIDFQKRFNNITQQNVEPRLTMVDINHHDGQDEFANVIDYYKKNFENQPLFRFILSHPHKDHLKGIKNLLNESGITVSNFWDLEHNFEPPQDGLGWEDYQEDWERYTELRKNSSSTGIIRRFWDNQNDVQFWSEDGIEILSPSKELHKIAHYKDDGTEKDPTEVEVHKMPYVLLININSLKILLASDADDQCWEYIVNNYGDKIKNLDILKASHHGRLSGFHEAAVTIMNPKYIIFSSTKDTDNDFGADTDYAKAAPLAEILKTHECGNLIASCDFDGNIEFKGE